MSTSQTDASLAAVPADQFDPASGGIGAYDTPLGITKVDAGTLQFTVANPGLAIQPNTAIPTNLQVGDAAPVGEVQLLDFTAGTQPFAAGDVFTLSFNTATPSVQVTYYTDLIIDQIVRPLVAAFETKYGIKVSFTRGDSQVNSLRLLNEYKAGRVLADVVGLTSAMEVLIDHLAEFDIKISRVQFDLIRAAMDSMDLGQSDRVVYLREHGVLGDPLPPSGP